jgi:hypothetical protein
MYAIVVEVGDESGANKDMRELVEFKMDGESNVLQFPSILR